MKTRLPLTISTPLESLIGELLVLNDELRELIIARAPARKLKEVARAAGTQPLREAAMRLVNNGETSLEEINRVTFVA